MTNNQSTGYLADELASTKLGRPRALDEVKQVEISALVACGATLKLAAEYVGCAPAPFAAKYFAISNSNRPSAMPVADSKSLRCAQSSDGPLMIQKRPNGSASTFARLRSSPATASPCSSTPPAQATERANVRRLSRPLPRRAANRSSQRASPAQNHRYTQKNAPQENSNQHLTDPTAVEALPISEPLPTDHGPPPTAHRPLPTDHCPLPTTLHPTPPEAKLKAPIRPN